VLDAGCGSGRLTVALAEAGHEVTGVDSHAGRLDRARQRAERAGVSVTLLNADLDQPSSLGADTLDAIVSRLVLMIPKQPAATLRSLCRSLSGGGVVATMVWAEQQHNAWFCAPRDTVRAVLGDDDASFARPFGRLGTEDELAAMHASAGLQVTGITTLRDPVHTPDAATHWASLVRDNGHYRTLDARLDADGRQRLLAALARELEPHRVGAELVLSRTAILVTARRA
jgi:2-polyprenyl-3-methyl-5-hydroxy-6-metoxy-1,4-benzoquinol methylase